MCLRVVVGVLLLAATVGCRSSADRSRADLVVDWLVGEDRPACVYDAKRERVDARLTITGRAPRHTSVTVTVTAYADENTSDPVGSGTRTIEVRGAVDRMLPISLRVDEPPHVDIDGVAACARTVRY